MKPSLTALFFSRSQFQLVYNFLLFSILSTIFYPPLLTFVPLVAHGGGYTIQQPFYFAHTQQLSNVKACSTFNA